MNLNKVIIRLVIGGYIFVNVFMQIDFFAGRNIWAKYYKIENNQVTEQNYENEVSEIEAGKKAYYAKTFFLLILLILLAFNVKFPLGFGISFFSYAILMLLFFGINRPTTIYFLASALTLITYFIPSKQVKES
ncbi:hypothetical protein V6Z05_15635 [Leptospira venezuelensis]|uniref:hypothetical protein n=1 Tax=Leptospira venezuelensis TaxID=1958811 RepID=UPI000A39093D|nr:hypothetical protein [Leptospira venezuelensis]